MFLFQSFKNDQAGQDSIGHFTDPYTLSWGENIDVMTEMAVQNTNVILMPAAQPEQPRSMFDMPRCTFSPVGLIIERGMPIDDWVELGKRLKRAGESVGIWRGDYINYGKHEYGKKYEAAVALTGLKEQTLMNDVWISKAVPISVRSEKLTTKHYRYLAPLRSINKIRKWIEKAVQGDGKHTWSASRLNKEINKTVAPVATCERDKNYLNPHYKQFLLDFIASLDSFYNRCPYEPFNKVIYMAKRGAEYQLRRTAGSDLKAVQKQVDEGATTVTEIAEEVPLSEADIEVFCQRLVGCPRPTAEEDPHSAGTEYEWRPIGPKLPQGKGVRPRGIFSKKAPWGSDFNSGYNPRVQYDEEEEHF